MKNRPSEIEGRFCVLKKYLKKGNQIIVVDFWEDL